VLTRQAGHIGAFIHGSAHIASIGLSEDCSRLCVHSRYSRDSSSSVGSCSVLYGACVRCCRLQPRCDLWRFSNRRVCSPALIVMLLHLADAGPLLVAAMSKFGTRCFLLGITFCLRTSFLKVHGYLLHHATSLDCRACMLCELLPAATTLCHIPSTDILIAGGKNGGLCTYRSLHVL